MYEDNIKNNNNIINEDAYVDSYLSSSTIRALYKRGIRPQNKWNRSDILDELRIKGMDDNKIKLLSKLLLVVLRNVVLRENKNYKVHGEVVSLYELDPDNIVTDSSFSEIVSMIINAKGVEWSRAKSILYADRARNLEKYKRDWKTDPRSAFYYTLYILKKPNDLTRQIAFKDPLYKKLYTTYIDKR